MKPNYKLTLFRYITALCLLIITQIVFYLLNSTLFNVNSFKDFLNICFGNLRFALSSLSFYLAPFLLLALCLYRFTEIRFIKLLFPCYISSA